MKQQMWKILEGEVVGAINACNRERIVTHRVGGSYEIERWEGVCHRKGRGRKEHFRKGNCTGKSCEENQDSKNIRVCGASLVAQGLRVCLPMQGTRVRALVWEDPTCRGATRPVSHNYWACASEACAPQQERPRRRKARAPWWRVAPTCCN